MKINENKSTIVNFIVTSNMNKLVNMELHFFTEDFNKIIYLIKRLFEMKNRHTFQTTPLKK